MKYSESTKNIFKALAEFKKDFRQPMKDADNPFFKSKYVPLEKVVQAIDAEAPKHGLGYMQSTVSNEQGQAGVITVITHASGEYVECDALYLKPDKTTPQGMGSAITYARRYALSSAFGVASDIDDDGNEASGNGKKQKKDPELEGKQQFLADQAKKFAEHGMSKTSFYAGLGQRLGVEQAIDAPLKDLVEKSKEFLAEVEAQ